MRRAGYAASLLVLVLLSSSLLFLSVPGTIRAAGSNNTGSSVITSKSNYSVGAGAYAGTLDFANKYIYISGQKPITGPGFVTVLDPATGIIVKNISDSRLGYLTYVAYDNDTNKVYVSDPYHSPRGVVWIIDPSTNTIVANITFKQGSTPWGITYAAHMLFITDGGNSTLDEFNPQTGKFVANVSLTAGGFPAVSSYDASHQYLYVSEYYSDGVAVVDTASHTLVKTISMPSGSGPWGVFYSPQGKLYVTEIKSNLTAIVDPVTGAITKTINVGNSPDAFAYNPDPLIAISSSGFNDATSTQGIGTTNFIDPFTDELVGVINTPHGPQMVIFDWYLGEFFIVEQDGFLQGLLINVAQPTTSTSQTQTTPTTSSTSTTSTAPSSQSSSSQSSASQTSTTQPSQSTQLGGGGGFDFGLITDPFIWVPIFGFLILVFILLPWIIHWRPRTPPEEPGTEGTDEGTEEGTDDGTGGDGGHDGTGDGTEEGTEEGTGTEEPPKPVAVCGPDVSKELVGILETVIDDWFNLGPWDRLKQIAGMGLWNIDPLRDNISRITPADCGCPKSSPCDATVMVYGKCIPAGIVNYAIWGVIECLTHQRVLGSVLHGLYWLGKETVGNLTGAAPTSLHVGVYESYMVSVGREFYDRGVDGMIVQLSKIPGEPCAPCPHPPKRYPWRYTWFPMFPNELSKH